MIGRTSSSLGLRFTNALMFSAQWASVLPWIRLKKRIADFSVWRAPKHGTMQGWRSFSEIAASVHMSTCWLSVFLINLATIWMYRGKRQQVKVKLITLTSRHTHKYCLPRCSRTGRDDPNWAKSRLTYILNIEQAKCNKTILHFLRLALCILISSTVQECFVRSSNRTILDMLRGIHTLSSPGNLAGRTSPNAPFPRTLPPICITPSTLPVVSSS